MRETVDMVEPLAEQNGNRVSVELPVESVTMRSDAVKVRQVCSNVLGNACKFTSNGSRERRVSTSRADGDIVRFEVEDTGIGMTPEELADVFEPFVQADSWTTRRYGGTGLGLSITERSARCSAGASRPKARPGAVPVHDRGAA